MIAMHRFIIIICKHAFHQIMRSMYIALEVQSV